MWGGDEQALSARPPAPAPAAPPSWPVQIACPLWFPLMKSHSARPPARAGCVQLVLREAPLSTMVVLSPFLSLTHPAVSLSR